MTANTFIKIGDHKGEAKDQKQKGKIEKVTPGGRCCSFPQTTHSANANRITFCLVALTLMLCTSPVFSQHIYQLSYTGPSWSWKNTDLSALTGSSGTGFYSGMTAFVTTPNNNFHLYYQDALNNIHQLYFNGLVWSDGNLTTATKGATALLTGSGISGFSIGNFQYIYFVGSDQHIHEYSYVDNWLDTDLTVKAHGVVASSINRLVTFATSPNNQRHVYFVATDATIHQLDFNGTLWSDENLTNVTGGGKAAPYATAMGGCAVGNHQYVFFVSNTGHLHMYSYVNSWTDTDWTNRSGLTAFGSVTGFGIPETTKLRMYFDDASGYHLHQLSYDDANPNNWVTTDLTTQTGSGYVLPGFNSVGFATTPNDQLHFYTIAGATVAQYYFNGFSWSLGYLPAPTTNNSNGMAGFAMGNSQYVYYVYQGSIQ
jgi:hypothetical protein